MERESERRAYRGVATAGIPRWYRPWLHLGATIGLGLALGVPALLVLQHPRPWHLLFALGVLIVSNASEWRAHRNMLHRRTPGFRPLYDRHTPSHHRMFVTWDMEVRDPREYALVFIPPYGIFAIFVSTLPVCAVLLALGQRDLASVFVASSMIYVVSYECLHGCYHAPADSWIGRRGLVRTLRRHHAAHHDPALMQKWNFNVTVPLWDWVQGTIAPSSSARWKAPDEPRS